MPETQPRRLEDFEPLTPAEQKVLDELDTGKFIIFGMEAPSEDAGSDKLIRARFLRWVVLGCSGSNINVHEKGVRISGALVAGEGDRRAEHASLDLEGVEVRTDLGLANCRFIQAPELIGARLQSLLLSGSQFPGLRADRLETERDLFLRQAFCKGEIRLLGAKIRRELDLDGAVLTNDGGITLNCPNIRVDSNLLMRGTKSDGEVNLIGAEVRGDLDLGGAVLENPSGYALCASRMRNRGTFFWVDDITSRGLIDLIDFETGAINDDPDCWPEKGNLVLDRCRYGAFTGKGVSAKERLRWLALQDEARWVKDFWPQPYEQCAKVLREMGHQDDAREILIEKERRLRAARRAKLLGPKLWWQGFWDTFLAWTVSYGQKPFQAGYWLALLWLLGTASFWTLHAHDQFKPNNAFVLRAPEWANCSPEYAPPHKYLGKAGQSQLACFKDRSEAKGLPEFNPFVYSLDVLFPLVQLEQQVHWIPDDDQPLGAWGKALVYVQIVMGWLLSLLAVAGLSGIIKSD